MTQQRCATCCRGIPNGRGAIACAAAVDDAALLGEPGVNAIWAERKYGRETLLGLMAGRPMPTGTDCENMALDDGADCKMWKAP
jgi:hypothetical protein